MPATYTDEVRPPAVAGMFYPAHPAALRREVERLFARAAGGPVKGDILALISPHAGYQYSGYTAARGYAQLQNRRFEAIAIIAPSHREYFNGISVYNGRSYATPLGAVPVASALRNDLLKNETLIQASATGHREEHAIEVQLPFLQCLLGEIPVLPIVMGDQRRDYCYHLGEKLAVLCDDRRILLVATTDLSHYHPYETANALDRIITEDIGACDHEKLMQDLEEERGEACGGGPIVAILLAAKRLRADKVEILHYCNSGDVTGDRSGVVGYLSAIALRNH